jgi:hypothetical protein
VSRSITPASAIRRSTRLAIVDEGPLLISYP